MNERICDVRWEGPFAWSTRADHLTQDHVLYALYGAHHLYGQSVLLYIGMTEVEIGTQLTAHVGWVKGEFDAMMLKVATVGLLPNVEAWCKSCNLERRYERADESLVKDVEALLIYAHLPAYNMRGKNSLVLEGGPLRIFNTGKIGLLLPELSSVYYDD